MRFLDYDNLIEVIGDWLSRDDLSDVIPDFVWLAETDIQRTVDFMMQDKVATGNTVNLQEWIQLPDDYLVGKYIRFISGTMQPEIEISSYDHVNTLQGRPSPSQHGNMKRGAFVHGTKLYIGPTPGGDDEYELFYKAGVQHLSKNIQTNRILQQYPDCLLFGSLALAAPYLGNDERLQTWIPLYENAKEETRQSEWRARSGVGTLRMRPEVYTV